MDNSLLLDCTSRAALVACCVDLTISERFSVWSSDLMALVTTDLSVEYLCCEVLALHLKDGLTQQCTVHSMFRYLVYIFVRSIHQKIATLC